MKQNLSKISVLFLSPFHFLSDNFDMDSGDFDFDTLIWSIAWRVLI